MPEILLMCTPASLAVVGEFNMWACSGKTNKRGTNMSSRNKYTMLDIVLKHWLMFTMTTGVSYPHLPLN